MLQPVQPAAGACGFRTTCGLQVGKPLPLKPVLARNWFSRSPVRTATAAGACLWRTNSSRRRCSGRQQHQLAGYACSMLHRAFIRMSSHHVVPAHGGRRGRRCCRLLVRNSCCQRHCSALQDSSNIISQLQQAQSNFLPARTYCGFVICVAVSHRIWPYNLQLKHPAVLPLLPKLCRMQLQLAAAAAVPPLLCPV